MLTPPNSPPLLPPNSLPPSLLERYFARHEFSTPLLACCSDVEPLTVGELLEISGGGKGKGTNSEETLFEGLSLGYLDPRGSPRLREAVAREHGGGGGCGIDGDSAVTADDVLVAAPQELAYLLQRAVLQGKERERKGETEREKKKKKRKLTPCPSSFSLFLSTTMKKQNFLMQEGDTVVAQWPGYPGLTAVAEAVGATVVPWLPRWEEEEEMEEEEESSRSHSSPRRKTLRPRFDVEEDLRAALEKAASLVRDPPPPGDRPRRRPSALRLAVLNFPHNPTGCSLPSGAAGLERAIALCLETPGGGARHVLSDEMYRGLHLTTAEALPTAAALAASSPALAGHRERVASLGGLSKWGGAPGLRVGWLVTRDRGLLERISALRDHTTICNSAPSEALALAALEGNGESGSKGGGAAALRARARAIVEGNLAAARAFFRSNADLFEFYAPDASTTCLPRLRAEVLGGGVSVDEFARRAREEAGVLLLPASAFGGIGGGDEGEAPAFWMEGRFRLGLGRRNLSAALEALGVLADKVRGEKTGAGLL